VGSKTESRTEASTACSCWSRRRSAHGHGMLGRPLQPPLSGDLLLVLCILPCGDDTGSVTNLKRQRKSGFAPLAVAPENPPVARAA
jgi:hypothetical protein